MKKHKSFFAAALSLTLLWGLLPASAALQVSGEAQHTDIGAYINHYPIPSYAVNGTSVVVAEDLRSYGFSVDWDSEAFTLSITRNLEADTITPVSFQKAAVPNGTKFADLYVSDVKVLAEGQRLPSYSMNGYTMIPLESLSLFGEVVWMPELRAVKLWIDGLPMTQYAPIPIGKTYNDYDAFLALFWQNPISAAFDNFLNHWDGWPWSDYSPVIDYYYYWLDQSGEALKQLLLYAPKEEHPFIQDNIQGMHSIVNEAVMNVMNSPEYAEEVAQTKEEGYGDFLFHILYYYASESYAREIFYELYQYTGTVSIN